MQRAICVAWMFAMAAVIPIGFKGVVAAQRIPDPAPIDDDEGFSSELPQPVASTNAVVSSREDGPAFLGVTFEPRLRDAAVVRSISPGSPADLAGLVAGDTLVALNGQETRTYDDVQRAVAAMRPGDTLDIEITRRVTLQARAVLDTQPIGGAPTTRYRVEAESLPAPNVYEQPSLQQLQQPQRATRVPAGASQPRSRQNATGQQQSREQNRSRNVDRDDDDRDERGRFRGRFRRRG